MNQSKPTFDQLLPEEQEWLDAYLDGSIEPADFDALQERLLRIPDLRNVMRRYLVLDSSLRREADDSGEGNSWLLESPGPKRSDLVRFPVKLSIARAAAVAAIAFLIGTLVIVFRPEQPLDIVAPNQSAQGFAVFTHLFDAEWASSESRFQEGDTIGPETFNLVSGTAEIQFFSGAVMTVEGPSEIFVKSAWEASCLKGAVRMQVPPAARGFKLQAPTAEIIDLGTEFGLEVRGGESHLEVFDGEIAVRHQGVTEQQLVTKGNALDLSSKGEIVPAQLGAVAFPDARNFGSQAKRQLQTGFRRWENHRDSLSRDDRLIAYYAFDREPGESLIPDLKLPRNPEFDGAVILAEPVDGRWPGLKSALEFRRPGSRVRVNIPGEFSALTFATWVRIDSLDRRYNALFMGDSYESGEPHWQIRDDGALMLSVMVDDTKANPGAPKDAGFHRVYFSPPVWDMSMAGQWMHLASVYDPTGRVISHFVNGEKISSEIILEKFHIDTLRIGNAEIGNWGQPFREDPWFAIRNLNGRMDEIVIFDAALKDAEVRALFEASRSVR